MKKNEFDDQIKQALNEKPKPSAKFEAELFARAENLLAKRREQIVLRESAARQASQAWSRKALVLRQYASRAVEFFAIHPDTPAAAATLATLVLAFLALHHGHEAALRPRYSDLPALLKNNDAPARYEAQRLAEQQAYEREVEDAHEETSGGI